MLDNHGNLLSQHIQLSEERHFCRCTSLHKFYGTSDVGSYIISANQRASSFISLARCQSGIPPIDGEDTLLLALLWVKQLRKRQPPPLPMMATQRGRRCLFPVIVTEALRLQMNKSAEGGEEGKTRRREGERGRWRSRERERGREREG